MRIIIKLILGLVLLISLLSALTLLLFNLPVGKSLLTGELRKRTGIECTYGSIVPQSIDQIRLTEFRAFPQDNVTLERVEIDFNLRESFQKRRPSLNALAVTKPIIKLEAEPLFQLLKSAIQKRPVAQKASVPDKLLEKEAPTPMSNPAQSEKPIPQASKPPPPPPTAKKREEREPLPYPSISITDAELHLTSSRFPQHALSVVGLSLSTDESALHRAGEIHLKGIHLLGKALALDLKQPIQLIGKQVRLPKKTHQISGLEVTVGGQAMLNRYLPFQGAMVASVISPVSFSHPLVPQFIATVEESQLVFQTSGALASPHSINASLTSSSDSVKLSIAGRGEQDFTDHRTEVVLRHGQLTAPTFHFKSDDLSLMGNGIMTSSGKGNAVVRMVSNETWKDRYSLLTNGLRLPVPAKTMEELDTADRYVKDFFLKLTPEHGAQYQFSGEEEWTSLDFLTSRLKSFTAREFREPLEPLNAPLYDQKKNKE